MRSRIRSAAVDPVELAQAEDFFAGEAQIAPWLVVECLEPDSQMVCRDTRHLAGQISVELSCIALYSRELIGYRLVREVIRGAKLEVEQPPWQHGCERSVVGDVVGAEQSQLAPVHQEQLAGWSSAQKAVGQLYNGGEPVGRGKQWQLPGDKSLAVDRRPGDDAERPL